MGRKPAKRFQTAELIRILFFGIEVYLFVCCMPIKNHTINV